jgi:hypothetical protein
VSVARSVVLLVKVVVAVGREMAAEVVVELAVAVVVEVEVAVAGGVLLSSQNVHHHIDYFI